MTDEELICTSFLKKLCYEKGEQKNSYFQHGALSLSCFRCVRLTVPQFSLKETNEKANKEANENYFTGKLESLLQIADIVNRIIWPGRRLSVYMRDQCHGLKASVYPPNSYVEKTPVW